VIQASTILADSYRSWLPSAVTITMVITPVAEMDGEVAGEEEVEVAAEAAAVVEEEEAVDMAEED